MPGIGTDKGTINGTLGLEPSKSKEGLHELNKGIMEQRLTIDEQIFVILNIDLGDFPLQTMLFLKNHLDLECKQVFGIYAQRLGMVLKQIGY